MKDECFSSKKKWMIKKYSLFSHSLTVVHQKLADSKVIMREKARLLILRLNVKVSSFYTKIFQSISMQSFKVLLI